MPRNFSDRLAIPAQARPRRPARRGCRVQWKARAREFSFQANRALIFRLYLEQNPARLRGNEFGKAVRPFNYRDAVAEKVIVESKPRERCPIFQPKEIEMINRQTSSRIFMDNGKRRAGDCCITTQAGNETFCEKSFAASQFAFECQNRSNTDIFRSELPANCLGFSWAVGNERSHRAMFDV